VELAAGVAEALLASAESAEVLTSLWDLLCIQVEIDPARSLYFTFVSDALGVRIRCRTDSCMTRGKDEEV